MGSSPMKKSFSIECLTSSFAAASSSSPSSSSSSSLVSIEEVTDKMTNGYLSDGLMGRAQERKKGVPWTEEEHRTFLAGLEKLGKGDWRGISRKFVTTRTPTQVASHAQKYFLRLTSLIKKKRRSSLFDVVGSFDNRVPTSSQFKDQSISCELHATTLSLNTTNGYLPINLNGMEQETQELPLCQHLMLPSSDTMEHQAHLPLPDLELTISSYSSRPLEQTKPSPRTFLAEKSGDLTCQGELELPRVLSGS